jgi:hypothetical protein
MKTQLSDTIANSYKSRLFSTKVEKARNPLTNNGNNVLPKTPMPWILPLDIPVPELPSQMMKWPDCAKRANVSNASAKDT